MNIGSVIRILGSVAAAALITIGIGEVMKDGAEINAKRKKVAELMNVVQQQDVFIANHTNQ